MQGQLGQDWLDFSRTQFASSQQRQSAEDALVGRVVNSGLATQDQANAWASQDRARADAAQTKYDGWADADRASQLQDRAAGRAAQDKLNGLAGDALTSSKAAQDQLNGIAGNQLAFSKGEQDRYNKTFVPIQDKFAADAMNWDSADRLASEAGKARSDVMAGAAQAKDISARQLAGMGVNPNSGRFAGVTRSTDTAAALAAAGAQNNARDNARQQALALRGQAIQVGQQVVGNSTTAAGLGMNATQAAYSTGAQGRAQAVDTTTAGLAAAGIGNTGAASSAQLSAGQAGAGYAGLGMGLNAGNAALGAQQQGNAAFLANNGIMNQGYQGAMAGYAGQGAGLNNLYGNQLQGYQAQQQGNAATMQGIGSMVGTGAALFL